MGVLILLSFVGDTVLKCDLQDRVLSVSSLPFASRLVSPIFIVFLNRKIVYVRSIAVTWFDASTVVTHSHPCHRVLKYTLHTDDRVLYFAGSLCIYDLFVVQYPHRIV